MKRFNFQAQAITFAGLALVCLQQVRAEDPTFEFTDQNTSNAITFTNTVGSAEVVDGMIVFEGQLDATYPVGVATNPTTSEIVASLRLLTQVKLFDELPASNEVGNVQGAVAALRDAPESTTGEYYVWAVTNSASPITWVPLYIQNTTDPFAVTEGATNYITFVFNYTDTTNTPAGPVTYQLFIGATPTTQVASEPVVSATSEISGITGVSLLGVGGLETVASASGKVGPLSSSIGFSVYATAGGVLLILDPVDEQGSGWFTVFAKINGEWVEVGKVEAKGAGHYEFLAYPGILQVGQSYAFKVVDEENDPHELGTAVEIKTIKMDSITLEPGVMVVTFNSEKGRSYQVISAATLTAETWTETSVHYPLAENNWGYGTNVFTAGGTSTTIKVPRNEEKKFFKIRKTN